MNRLLGTIYMLFLVGLLPWSESVMLDFNWPKVKVELKFFPHQQSCSKYYLVDSSGDYALKECPKEQRFDYITLTCRAKTLAQCWSNMLDPGYKPVSIPEPFKCPFDWGLYPDITDCSKYFTCHIGIAHHKQCPSSQRFDKVQETCISERKAMCADESDVVEEGFKCPYTWGAFTYSKDCSKYYECFLKKPVLKTCKPGDLYDATQKICERKEEVDCGSRYNPYGDIHASTTELIASEEEVKQVKTGSSGEEVPTLSPDFRTEKLEATQSNAEISVGSTYETTNQEAIEVQSTIKSASRINEIKKQEVSKGSNIQSTEISTNGAYETTKQDVSESSTTQSSNTFAKEAYETKKQDVSESSTTESSNTFAREAYETTKQKGPSSSAARSTLGSYNNTVSKAIQTNYIVQNISDSSESIPVKTTEKEKNASS